jgi:Ca-activated chloride channel homolog
VPLRLCITICALLACTLAKSQYYIRGEVRDEKSAALQNVRIIQHSTHTQYLSGTGGEFGITARVAIDSLTFSLDGYEPKTVKVDAQIWQNISLKVLASVANKNRPRLISITKDFKQNSRYKWRVNNETYFQLVENEPVNASRFPNTGFALNINKASYSNIRRFINMGSAVPPDAVRTEELLNYFNLHYREPQGKHVFNIESNLTSCPWDDNKQLLFVDVNAKKLDLSKVPAGNFVFLIDVSGSMDMPNRLPLLKASFQLFVKNLRTIDTVSIVTYGGVVGVHLKATSGAEKEKILQSIEELDASGDTPGASGIAAAYQVARSSFIKGGNNRVILATDGDFNVGATSEKALDDLITKEKQGGVFLTCLGVGMGNFKDSKLETLAKRGNGNYAYLDDIREAEKVLVKELTQTFYGVADNVFLNMHFNEKWVKEYRLIGFDNKRDAVADSTIEIEGGEVGSGSSVLAVFEIVPTDEGIGTGAIRDDKDGLATLTLRYNLRGDAATSVLQQNCSLNFTEFKNIDKELQFATAVTMFGLKVKLSKYIKDADWAAINTIAQSSHNPQDYLQTQFLVLLEKARKVYKGKKGKKKNDDD